MLSNRETKKKTATREKVIYYTTVYGEDIVWIAENQKKSIVLHTHTRYTTAVPTQNTVIVVAVHIQNDYFDCIVYTIQRSHAQSCLCISACKETIESEFVREH